MSVDAVVLGMEEVASQQTRRRQIRRLTNVSYHH
jgi:hypothetical protein